MKTLKLLFFIFLVTGTCVLHATKPHLLGRSLKYEFNVHKRIYTFSTEFEIEYGGVQFAQVVKSAFRVTTNYDLYNDNGQFIAKGVHSYFPSYGLGWFYSWAADINVYDNNGNYLGMVDGTVYTEATAKFNFYNSLNERVAIAYMDKECKNFVITDPNNATHKIADLIRHTIKFETDSWTVRVYDEDVIPPEMVQIFATFACDRQSQFLKDE